MKFDTFFKNMPNMVEFNTLSIHTMVYLVTIAFTENLFIYSTAFIWQLQLRADQILLSYHQFVRYMSIEVALISSPLTCYNKNTQILMRQ